MAIAAVVAVKEVKLLTPLPVTGTFRNETVSDKETLLPRYSTEALRTN
jgi:hypothetical protein